MILRAYFKYIINSLKKADNCWFSSPSFSQSMFYSLEVRCSLSDVSKTPFLTAAHPSHASLTKRPTSNQRLTVPRYKEATDSPSVTNMKVPWNNEEGTKDGKEALRGLTALLVTHAPFTAGQPSKIRTVTGPFLSVICCALEPHRLTPVMSCAKWEKWHRFVLFSPWLYVGVMQIVT